MPKFDFTAVPTNELIRMRDELNRVIADRKIEDFTRRMQELLDEIHTAGCIINFEATTFKIYSDEPTFSFEVM